MKNKNQQIPQDVKYNQIIIAVRLVLSSVLLGLGSVVLDVERFTFYGLIGGFYLLSIVYLLLMKTKISQYSLTKSQLAFDCLLVLGVLYFCGGVHSVFISFLLLPLVAAGMILSLSGCVLITLIASAGFLVLSVLDYLGQIPSIQLIGLQQNSLPEFVFMTFVRLLIFWAVSLLSAYLAQKLKVQTHSYMNLKQLHEIILDQIGSGIITVNVKNEIVYMNPGAESLVGAKSNEMYGKNWKTLFFFTNANFSTDSWEETAQVLRGYEVSLKRKNGSKIPIGFNVTRLTDQSKNYCGKVMVFRDLTRVKELEEKQRLSQRLAAVGELAAGIAHEIRNPLASISGSVEVLNRKKAFDQKYSTLVDIILRETQRLNDIIESFLSFSRKPKIEKRFVDLENILDEVMVLLRNNGKWRDKHQIEKVNHIKGKTQFWFDPNQVKQVFYNLIANACEVMSSGGNIEITLSHKEEENMIRVDVADQGSGIPEHKLSSIFTPFYTTKKYGTGLGLAIVHRIIQEHGGNIQVKNGEKLGATFSIFLPKGNEVLSVV